MIKKVALLFPGSGSQYVGMGKAIYAEYEVARRTIEEANDTLGMDLGQICFEGSVIKLNRVENVLTSIFTVSVAWFRVYLEEIGLCPSYLAGHSLGEYSALCCSDAISFKEALLLVKKRAELADKVRQQSNGTMTVLKNIDPDTAEKICSKYSDKNASINVSCYNSPSQVMISGSENLILLAEKEALRHGAVVVPFVGTPPYHSLLMKAISAEFEAELMKVHWKDFKYPIISNTTALPYQSKDVMVGELARQIYSPVLWYKTIQFIQQNNIDTMLEVGPQSVLKKLIKETDNSCAVYSLDEGEDFKFLCHNLVPKAEGRDVIANKSVPSSKLLAIKMCLGIAASTRNNNSDTSANEDFISAYNVINDISKSLEKTGSEPSEEQVARSLNMLNMIFDCRQTPSPERQYRFSQIAKMTGQKI